MNTAPPNLRSGLALLEANRQYHGPLRDDSFGEAGALQCLATCLQPDSARFQPDGYVKRYLYTAHGACS